MKKIGCCLSLAVLLGACDVHVVHYEKDWKTADAAADVFHQYWTQGQFSAMYAMSGELLRQHQTERDFVQAAEQAMQIYGPIKESHQLRAACVLNQVSLVYQTDFRNGKASERMIWQVRDDKAELLSYEIVPGEVDTSTLPDSSCSK